MDGNNETRWLEGLAIAKGIAADCGADQAQRIARGHADAHYDDWAAAGLWEYPAALPIPLRDALEAWCVGITESRPPNQVIGRGDGPGDPYIDRWFLARKAQVPTSSGYPDFADVQPYLPSELENLYLHRYHRGDADEPHDHPWPNASLVVRGWFVEAIYDGHGTRLGSIRRFPGDIVLRSAKSVHAILETSEDCLSLFATLRKERDWGFHTADGFVPWREFGRS